MRKALLVAAVVVLACGAPPNPARGPILLVTLSAVRADAIGPRAPLEAPTPRLDALLEESDWAGTAVVASSDPMVSLASLHMGVSPWQHQLLSTDDPRHRHLTSLAQALQAAGYRTAAHVPGYLHRSFGDGFDRLAEPPEPGEIAGLIDGLRSDDFLWIHFPDAEITYGRSKTKPGEMRLSRRRLLPYADPEVSPPAEIEALLAAFYRRGLDRVDRLVGEIWARLQTHPLGSTATVVVTASHGTELGDDGQILHSENLGRSTIEVPLAVKLPADAPPLAEAPGRIEQTRLWATLVERAGRHAAPVHPPSLDRISPAPILSELYRKNGANLFSLVDGDVQLLWTARFAPPEPHYYLAQWMRAGGQSERLEEPPARLFQRLDTLFQATPPLTGAEGSPPSLTLASWSADGSAAGETLPADKSSLSEQLAYRWLRFVDRERPPSAERTPDENAADGIY